MTIPVKRKRKQIKEKHQKKSEFIQLHEKTVMKIENAYYMIDYENKCKKMFRIINPQKIVESGKNCAFILEIRRIFL